MQQPVDMEKNNNQKIKTSFFKIGVIVMLVTFSLIGGTPVHASIYSVGKEGTASLVDSISHFFSSLFTKKEEVVKGEETPVSSTLPAPPEKKVYPTYTPPVVSTQPKPTTSSSTYKPVVTTKTVTNTVYVPAANPVSVQTSGITEAELEARLSSFKASLPLASSTIVNNYITSGTAQAPSFYGGVSQGEVTNLQNQITTISQVGGSGSVSTSTIRQALSSGTGISYNSTTGVISAVGEGGLMNNGTGINATAVGGGSIAPGNQSSAFGSCNTASGFGSSAFGYFNTACGCLSSTLGYFNIASGCKSLAIGSNSTASGSYSFAFGSYINNSTANSVEIGADNSNKLHIDADGVNFITSGSGGFCVNGIVVGNGTLSTTTLNSLTQVAIGKNNATSTLGINASTLGVCNTANSTGATAVGFNNTSSGQYSSAFGKSNIAAGNNSVAIGYGNISTSSCSSICGNTAIGFNNCATGGSIFGVAYCYSSAFGNYNTASSFLSTAFGNSNNAIGQQSISFGILNSSCGNLSVAAGSNNTTCNNGSIAIGRINTASGIYASAMGSCNYSRGNNSSAVGYCNNASSTLSSAFGFGNTASGYKSSTFGTSLANSDACSSQFGGRYNIGGTCCNAYLSLSLSGANFCVPGTISQNGGAPSFASDRNLKENFQDIDKQSILNKINSLPMQQWNYIGQGSDMSHIAPIAQDFYSLFNLNNSSTSISAIDPAGIALVGIQALSQRLDALAGSSTFSSFTISTSSLTSNSSNSVIAALESFGAEVVDGVAYLKDVFVEKLTVNEITTEKINVTEGIQMKSPDGTIYCVKVANGGSFINTTGLCDIQPATVIVSPPSVPTEATSSSPEATTTANVEIIATTTAETLPTATSSIEAENSPAI